MKRKERLPLGERKSRPRRKLTLQSVQRIDNMVVSGQGLFADVMSVSSCLIKSAGEENIERGLARSLAHLLRSFLSILVDSSS